MADEYEAALAAVQGGFKPPSETAQFARLGMSQAVGTNPDLYAELSKVAQKTGVPMTTAMNMPDVVKRQATLGSIDFEQLAATSPATARLLGDMNKAKVSHDDIDNMSGLESVLRQAGSAAADAAKYITSAPGQTNTLLGDAGAGVLMANTGAAGVFRAAAENVAPLLNPLVGGILPENPLLRVAAGFAKMGADTERDAKRLSPPQSGIVAGGVSSGVQSFVQNALMLPMALMPGGAIATLTGMSLQQGGNAYNDARDAGVSPQRAGVSLVTQAGLEAAFEMGPLMQLVKDVKAGTPLFKTLMTNIALETPNEVATTLLQNADTWATINPTKSAGDFLREQPAAIAQTVIATMIGAGGNTMLMHSIQRVADTANGTERSAKQAEESTGILRKIAEFSAASKVRVRDADTFQAFMQDATQDGPLENVYVNPKDLTAAGIDLTKIGELVPSPVATPEAMKATQAAIESGQDIGIPTAELMTRLPGSELEQSLIPHLKTEAGGFSQVGAQSYMQNQGAETQALVEKVLGEKQLDDSFKQSADVVEQRVMEQLTTANRFTEDVNKPYAALWKAFFAVQAARTGVTPEALFNQYNPKILAQGAGGYDQALTLESLKAQWADQGVKNSVSESDDRITLSQIIVPEGERDKGAGTAALQQLLRYADSVGKHIVLSPSADFGGNKKRLTAFYKRFGFVENKGKSRAFTTRESMYRTSPGKVLNQSIANTLEEKLDEAARSEIQADQTNAAGAQGTTGAKKAYGVGVGERAGVQPEQAGDAGRLNQGARGSFNPATMTTTLLKAANLSTFLHESGHFFLEVQFDMAARISQAAGVFGAETNQAGEQQVVKDADAILSWMGVRDLTEWSGLSFEEKRSYHEQFARGFESYLMEGKAPSIEVQGAFQRFRSWLLNVYKGFKALNVELNDEVRGVMDRMLATSEQIQLAEEVRGYEALFSNKPDSMTDDEWRAYHAQAMDATQDAITQLEARSLRDMRWTVNARGREIAKLQKEAKSKRADVQREVQREVMAQPVYRAWRFLTSKITEEDKLPSAAPKARATTLDPYTDSLFEAIAKIGGLDRTQVQSQWGWDAKEKSPMPGFGQYLLRKNDGLSLDAMAERLAEEGYLIADDKGAVLLSDFEEKFQAEYRGDAQYSILKDYSDAQGEQRAGEGVDLQTRAAGRFDLSALKFDMGLPSEIVDPLINLKMTARDGLHPDLVAQIPGIDFSSGDELVRALVAAQDPKVVVQAMTDQRMLEKYGDLADQKSIERAAEEAIHNDARLKFVATEANALAKATGQPKLLAEAVRQFAAKMVARTLVRNIKPSVYTSAEKRAGKDAAIAMKANDLQGAAVQKRNQLINAYAAKAAMQAQDEAIKIVKYLQGFNKDSAYKSINPEYLDQIHQLLERFDLRSGQSLKALDKRTSLAAWLATQEEQGLEPDIPQDLIDSAGLISYKNVTVEAVRGLRDTVKQIEHLGRLKNQLLTAKDLRDYEAVRDLLVKSINDNAGDKFADNRTRPNTLNASLKMFEGYVLAHRKVASLAREMDGFKDAGPMWEYVIRTMNTAGDNEITMRAEATKKLGVLVKPLLARGKMGGKGKFFQSVNMSLNREEIIGMALNMGNEGNMQRLLGGEGWQLGQIKPVLDTLTAEDWQFVQSVWDFFESYRPAIGAKEKRVYGKEPNWIDAQALTVNTAEGGTLTLRGGYYPIKYDTAQSGRAEQLSDAEVAKQQLKGAYTSSTTRRSFTKARAEEVNGRPLLYSMDGLYQGVNEVIHDLSWHEWLIDANKLMRSKSIDNAIRSRYGAQVMQQFKSAIQSIAAGEMPAQDNLERGLNNLRAGAMVAGLGFNIMNSIINTVGLTQTMVRIGPKWTAVGFAKFVASPIALAQEVREKSQFMASRASTLNREVTEIQSLVRGRSTARATMDRILFLPLELTQAVVDTPSWWGAYSKALDEGHNEDRAVALADQAVLDAQSGGQTKDMALVQRGGPVKKLLTTFYGFFSSTYNLAVETGKATDVKDPMSVVNAASKYMLLLVLPSVLGTLIKAAFTGGGDDPEKLAKALANDQISYLMGMMVGLREATGAAQTVAGVNEYNTGYGGPAGLRFFQEIYKLAQQVHQGDADMAAFKAFSNTMGIIFKLPSGQINRTVEGVKALQEGETKNPMAVISGAPKK